MFLPDERPATRGGRCRVYFFDAEPAFHLQAMRRDLLFLEVRQRRGGK